MLTRIKYLYYKLCVLFDNIQQDVHYQVTRPEYNKLTFTYRTIPKIGKIAREVVWALGIYARGIRMAVVHFYDIILTVLFNVYRKTSSVERYGKDL